MSKNEKMIVPAWVTALEKKDRVLTPSEKEKLDNYHKGLVVVYIQHQQWAQMR